MKYFELSKEEKRILTDFEKGKLGSIRDVAKKSRLYQRSAKKTLDKTRNINIRLSERVLGRLKAKAAEEGTPYQTLAASILHKYASS